MLPALLLALACSTTSPAPDPDLSTDDVAAFVRDDVAEPEAWASDVRDALQAVGRPVDADHVCQVLAVVEQESGYDPDPAVPDLGRIAREAMEEELARLPGPLGPVSVAWLLSPTPAGAEQSFEDRLEEVRTEQDLDRLFRDLSAHHSQAADGVPFVEPIIDRTLERLNPVTTAGSMQVSVAWAQSHAAARDLDPADVRDALYTRAGGVHYGTARLFSHEADYDDPRYRFADFNAGPYASRNAAFQGQLSVVTGLALQPDGDLLSYTKRGKPRPSRTLDALLTWRTLHAPDVPELRVRRDARLEKDARFEDTVTWDAVRDTYARLAGEEPAYATVPDIHLDSPKITRDWTTAWFADRVHRRYTACLQRG